MKQFIFYSLVFHFTLIVPWQIAFKTTAPKIHFSQGTTVVPITLITVRKNYSKRNKALSQFAKKSVHKKIPEIKKNLTTPKQIQRQGSSIQGVLSGALQGQIKPQYPYMSRKFKEEGTVILEVKVLKTGKVAWVHIKKSSGFKRLDASALRAVRNSHFTTAQILFRNVAMITQLAIDFKLD